jgi:hypothetical protein
MSKLDRDLLDADLYVSNLIYIGTRTSRTTVSPYKCAPMLLPCSDVLRCAPMCSDVLRCAPMCSDVLRCAPMLHLFSLYIGIKRCGASYECRFIQISKD